MLMLAIVACLCFFASAFIVLVDFHVFCFIPLFFVGLILHRSFSLSGRFCKKSFSPTISHKVIFHCFHLYVQMVFVHTVHSFFLPFCCNAIYSTPFYTQLRMILPKKQIWLTLQHCCLEIETDTLHDYMSF